jgi:hypothetical protein
MRELYNQVKITAASDKKTGHRLVIEIDATILSSVKLLWSPHQNIPSLRLRTCGHPRKSKGLQLLVKAL